MPETFGFQRVSRRLLLLMVALGAAGACIAYFWQGRAEGAGFAAGAGMVILNFYLTKRMVELLGRGNPGRKGSAYGAALLLGLRYILLAVLGYAILKYLGASFLAAICGCFVHITAVLLESAYQSLYARTS